MGVTERERRKDGEKDCRSDPTLSLHGIRIFRFWGNYAREEKKSSRKRGTGRQRGNDKTRKTARSEKGAGYRNEYKTPLKTKDRR